jgi:phosphatidylinositol 3-kinase
MEDSITFSIFLEEKLQRSTGDVSSDENIYNDDDNDCQIRERPFTLSHVSYRSIYKWVEDGNVVACYKCKIKFGMFTRKHHCRSCGRIFCSSCSNNWTILPKNHCVNSDSTLSAYTKTFKDFITWNNEEKERVCDPCLTYVKEMKEFARLVAVFKHMDIKQLFSLTSVSKLWYKAAMYCLAKFRDIQYRLPTKQFTKWDKAILFANMDYIKGHNRWLVQVIRSVNNDDRDEIKKIVEFLSEKRKYTCWNTMCYNKCKKQLTSENVIELLHYKIYNNIIERYLVDQIENISDNEFVCYSPVFAKLLKLRVSQDNYILFNYVIKKCLKSTEILVEIYSAIKINMRSYDSYEYSKLLDKFYESILHRAENENIFKLLDQILLSSEKIKMNINSRDTVDMIKTKISNYFSNITEIYNPIHPEICYNTINTNNITMKDSYCRPVIIPFVHKTEDKTIQHRIMFKHEDLRKDYIICKLIKLMSLIIAKEEGISDNIINYKVMPVDNTCGFIEIVEDSETINNIKNKMKFTIQNYILENNKTTQVGELRNRFITSVAAYCAITYLLGIGDRHLDNIMVHKSGLLFHIDYNYVLGNDPKLSSPIMRITPDMLNAMGGNESDDYKLFIVKCSQIFNCLRRHVNLFTNIILLLVDYDKNITIDKLESEIIKKFEPGENYIDAETHLVTQMEKSHETWQYDIVDFFHYYLKK